jgi:hypothetical protein
MNSVLIVSFFDWDTSVEIPFLFSKAGSKVDLFCKKGAWLQSNSYHNNVIEGSEDIDEFVIKLLAHIESNSYDFVILTEDPLLKYVNEKIVDPTLFIKTLPLIKINLREIISSKNGFSKFCIENNILTPKSDSYNSVDDYQRIINHLKFPLIQKSESGWGGMGISIIDNELALQKALENQEYNQNIMLQEYILGEDVRVDALYIKGKLIIYFCSKVLSHTTDKFSFSTRRKYYNNPEIQLILTELGEKTGANGFANITFIQEKTTANYYIIEMDLRPNSWMAYSQYFSDNNFITAIKSINSKKEFQNPCAVLFKNEIEVGLFYKDLYRAIFKKDIKGVLRWIFNYKNYWRFLPFYDFKLTKRIISQLWAETVLFKWRKWTGYYK